MLEQLKYINHLSETFEFGKDGIFVNYNQLHDYAWEVDTKGLKISAFSRKVQTKNLPVVIMCDSEAKGIAARNKLHEIAEKDIIAKIPGKIIIGSYYFTCYITSSEKSDYLINKKYMQVDLKLTSDQPYWVKETKTSFIAGETAGSGSDEGHGFPYDYPYDYASGIINKNLVNPGFADSDFKLVIYGFADHPSITIGDAVYTVNCNVETGSFLTVDSRSKKIFLTDSEGTETNVFALRGTDSYIFKKIPSGSNTVNWSGGFGFDLTLYEERSEPKWI